VNRITASVAFEYDRQLIIALWIQ